MGQFQCQSVYLAFRHENGTSTRTNTESRTRSRTKSGINRKKHKNCTGNLFLNFTFQWYSWNWGLVFLCIFYMNISTTKPRDQDHVQKKWNRDRDKSSGPKIIVTETGPGTSTGPGTGPCSGPKRLSVYDSGNPTLPVAVPDTMSKCSTLAQCDN